MYIFALKKDVVETFCLLINKQKLIETQSMIDEWYGKGKVQNIIAASTVQFRKFGKKLEIISKKRVVEETVDSSDSDMFNYKFYMYEQHPLSKICDDILKCDDSLELSEKIAVLINWTPKIKGEGLLLKELLTTFKFRRVSCDDIIESDLTIDKKRTLLQKMVDAIRKVEQPREIVFSSKFYEREVEKRICDMEIINSNLCRRISRVKDFKYSRKEKVMIKRNILSSLPKTDVINQMK